MRSLQEHLVVPVDDTAGRRKQLVYAPNEFVRIVPYAFSYIRLALYCLLVLCSGSILLIVSVWFPQIFTYIARTRLPYSSLGDAEYMLVLIHEDGFRSQYIEVKVQRPVVKKAGTKKDGDHEILTPSDVRQKMPFVWFEFKKHRYVFNHDKGEFERYLSTINEDLDTIRARLDCGLDAITVREKQEIFGVNVVDIDKPFIPMLLFTKIIHPYYLFQIFSLVVWYTSEYPYYATVILCLSAISMTWEIYSEVSNSNRLRSLVESNNTIQVYRPGETTEAKMVTHPERDLVPGDVVELTPGTVVADVLLLSGCCIVDEASLTGEPIPINKEAVRGKAVVTEEKARIEFKSSFLHAGSTITRIREAGGACKGVVLSTGFSTGKGELFRSIIFPKEITFEFERDSYRYLAVLATIAIAAFIKRLSDFSKEGYGFGYTLGNSLDLVTIAVPPALPLVLSSGVSFALNRLHKAGIFCIDSHRINSCGQLDAFCFDKTGTLTEEDLNLVGVDVVTETKQFERIGLDALTANFRLAMATCHSLSEVDGQLQGYSLELSMFKVAQLALEFIHGPTTAHSHLAVASDANGRKYGVVKRFPFDAAYQRSSVIVEDVETKQRFVFVKGSPEAIRHIALEVPADFKQKSLRYSADGNYCIGFGVRELAVGETVNVDAREAVESKVQFMGIALFHNELKPESKGMIAELYEADVDVRMITGDNALTAVHVARLLDMKLKSRVAIVDVNESSDVVYHCVEALRNADHVEWEALTNENLSRVLQKFDLALTGAALEKLQTDLSDESLSQLVLQTQIFARIRPTQKAWIVERLMDLGKVVGMCGDGTNDCGALKAAHVGLALSSAEASIVAPFTSKAKAVTDVPVLIREGRCALTTSFLGFKYMVLYPVIQLGMASTLGHLHTLLSNNQYIWDDIAIVLGLAMTMLYTASSTRLTKERPPNTLFSLSLVLSIGGQIVLYVAFFIGMFVIMSNKSWFCHRQDGLDLVEAYLEDPSYVNDTAFSPKVLENCMFYTNYTDQIDTDIEDIMVSYEDSTIWLHGHLSYFTVALAFNLKDRFRKAFYTNYYFTGYWILQLAINLWFMLDNSGTIDSAFQTLPLEMSYRWTMFGMWIAQFVLALGWELLVTWKLPEWRQARKAREELSKDGREGTARFS